MPQKLYVGNLPFTATEQEVRELFGQHGTIVSVNLITDRETGRSKGFGFVEMETEEAAAAAIEKLNNVELGGRNINVAEAHPRRPRNDFGGGGGYGGGRDRY